MRKNTIFGVALLAALSLSNKAKAVDCAEVILDVENAREQADFLYSMCGSEQMLVRTLGISLEWSYQGNSIGQQDVLYVSQPGLYQGTYKGSDGEVCYADVEFEVMQGSKPTAVISSEKDYVCSDAVNGEMINAEVSGVLSNSPQYTWFKGNEPLPGEDQLSIEAITAGNYTMVLNDGGCIVTSNQKSLYENQNCEPQAEICEHDGAWESTGFYQEDNRIAFCKQPVSEDVFMEVYPKSNDGVVVEWFKDNEKVNVESQAKLLINEEGKYHAKYRLADQSCFYSDTVEFVSVYQPSGGMGTVERLCDDSVQFYIDYSSDQPAYFTFKHNDNILEKGMITYGNQIPNIRYIKEPGAYTLIYDNGCQMIDEVTVLPCDDVCETVEWTNAHTSVNDSTIELCLHNQNDNFISFNFPSNKHETSWYKNGEFYKTTPTTMLPVYEIGNYKGRFTYEGQCYETDSLYIKESVVQPLTIEQEKYEICPGDSSLVTVRFTNYYVNELQLWFPSGMTYGFVSGFEYSFYAKEVGAYSMRAMEGCYEEGYFYVAEKENCTVTSTNELDAVDVELVPNPVSNSLNIIGVTGEFEISISDMLGVQLISSQNASTIDVSDLHDGQYVLKVTSGTTSITKVFVKE